MLSTRTLLVIARRPFFSSRFIMSDYDSRAQQYGFASKEEISKIVTQNPHAVLLDVRTSDEIAETGPFKIGDQPWVTSSCTPDSCPELEAKADQLLPDKSGEFDTMF
jgi:hypothetical protein